MALPKLNESPQYEMIVPSTGKKVKFRPYLVREEKILLMASESGDINQIMNAVINTVTACIDEDIQKDSLTTFDLEYLFIKIRSKSVGEKVSITLNCSECGEPHPSDIDLEEVKCSKAKKTSLIKIDDKISIEMKYPSYGSIDLNVTEDELGFAILSNSIEAVLTEDERIDISEESDESVRNFLESMTKQQFEKLAEFLEDMPQVKQNVVFDCVGCAYNNNIEIKGMQSFF
jgi:hypothetical protein